MDLLAVAVRTDTDLPWWQIGPLTLVAFGVLYVLYRLVRLPKDLRFRKRVQAVEAAAGEHPVFGARTVRSAADALFHMVQVAWDDADREALVRLADPQLAADWLAKLDADAANGERYRVDVKKGPRVDYVSLHGSTEGHPGEFVRVRMRATLRSRMERSDGTQRYLPAGDAADELWTLSRRDGDWIVFNTRTQEFAEEFLSEEIVAPR